MKKFFIYLLFLYLLISKSNSYLQIPFYRNLTLPEKEINLIDYLRDYRIFIQLDAGESKLHSTFNFNNYRFIINGQTKKYVPSKDTATLINDIAFYGLNYQSEHFSGFFIKDTFYLYNSTKNEPIRLDNFPFIVSVVSNLKNLDSFGDSIIGLKMCDNTYDDKEKGTSFIYLLKQNKLVENYIFTFKYKTNDEGEFIVGNYPHEIDNNYREENLRRIKGHFFNDEVIWEFSFDSIKVGEEEIGIKNKIDFSVRPGIMAPKIYKDIISKEFFEKLEPGKCFFVNNDGHEYTNEFTYYYCDKEAFNVTKYEKDFPPLIFKHNIFGEFVLTHKDLFKEINGKIYFLVIFNNLPDSRWTLGDIFLRKYQFVFDNELKTIGYYIQEGYKPTWRLVIILCLLLIIMTFLLIRKIYCEPKRAISETFEYDKYTKYQPPEQQRIDIN
jgi:hypothetical protein